MTLMNARTVRHVKRGTHYRILTSAILQWSAQRDFEYTPMVVYQDIITNQVWIRPLEEFTDGRFVAVE